MLFDTSVIIDARDAHSPRHAWAKEQIANAVADEGAVANTVASRPAEPPPDVVQVIFVGFQ
jgi:hypothetical protein